MSPQPGTLVGHMAAPSSSPLPRQRDQGSGWGSKRLGTQARPELGTASPPRVGQEVPRSLQACPAPHHLPTPSPDCQQHRRVPGSSALRLRLVGHGLGMGRCAALPAPSLHLVRTCPHPLIPTPSSWQDELRGPPHPTPPPHQTGTHHARAPAIAPPSIIAASCLPPCSPCSQRNGSRRQSSREPSLPLPLKASSGPQSSWSRG